MNTGQMKKRCHRMARRAMIAAGGLLLLLVLSQYLILTKPFFAQNLTLLGRVEGEAVTEYVPELLAGGGEERVYYVRLALTAGDDDLARIYLDGRLIGTIAGQAARTVAIAPSQRLTVEAARITTAQAIKIEAEGHKVRFMPLRMGQMATVFDDFAPAKK